VGLLGTPGSIRAPSAPQPHVRTPPRAGISISERPTGHALNLLPSGPQFEPDVGGFN